MLNFLASLLPKLQPPNVGPPVPKSLGVKWPWLHSPLFYVKCRAELPAGFGGEFAPGETYPVYAYGDKFLVIDDTGSFFDVSLGNLNRCFRFESE